MKIKRNVIIMYLVCFLQGMVFYSAIATLYRQAAGVSVFQITLIESISLALALFLELPWGILAEKIGYKNTMIVCCAIYVLSKIVFWQADGFGMFLLERIMLSVVMAGLSGVDTAVLYLSCEENYAHRAFSIYDNIGTAGMILAVGYYSFFIKEDYRMAGLATVFSYALAAVLVLFLKEVKPEEKRKRPLREFPVVLKQIIGRKEIILLLIAVALFRESNQTITVFLNQLQYVRCGMENEKIGFAYLLVTIAGLFGMFSAGLTEKWGENRLGLCLFFIGAVACGVLIFTKDAIISVLSIMALRVAFSVMLPIFNTVQNRQVTHENRATWLSVNTVIMDSAAIFTNLIFGKTADYNVSLAMGVGMMFCLIGMGMYNSFCCILHTAEIK